ncbi:hypothetical protein HBI95_044990 [Parastagonospora nodorum]|nr:hypothetical protein HBI95_044990 [Parastagonospora nodorum]
MTDIETNTPAQPVPFEHSPLPDSETHIRLLEVLQGNFAQHVVYPTLTATITIDGRDMVVRQNCEYTLQQTFAIEKKGKHVWVDAVCIDQSNIKERGHQVAIMGQVYKRAAQVFACVGPHAEDIKYLQIMSKKKKHLLVDVMSAVRLGTWYASLDFPDGGIRLGTRCLLSMSRSTEVKLKKALVAFLNRPYFSRVWILQELSMGTNVVVCCGATLILASHIMALDSLLGYDIGTSIRFEPRQDINIKMKYMKAVRLISRLCGSISCREDDNATLEAYGKAGPRFGCLVLAARGLEGRPPDLHSVMDHINEFECADVRDKLYGILNLVDWPPGSTPTPDYQKSTFDVAVDTLDSLGRWPIFGRMALSWAQHVATIFEISPMDVAIQDRLRMRRNNALSPQPGIPSSGHFRFSDYFWRGWPILAHIAEPQSRSLQGLYCAASMTKDGVVELVYGDDMPCVLAPPQTTAGDWIISMRSGETEYWDSTGMIIRSSDFYQYTIVGLARMTEHYSKLERRGFFWLHWDPEDLLLLHLIAREPDKLDIGELHSIQICGAKDSSFAVKE